MYKAFLLGKINHIRRSFEKNLSDTEQYLGIHFYILYLILAVIYYTISIFNFVNHNTSALIASFTFATACIVNASILKLTKRNHPFLQDIFILEFAIFLIYSLITGGPEDFSVGWICLFPSVALVMYRMAKGLIYSLSMLLILIFLLWTPLGKQFLIYPYPEIFLVRFPFYYISYCLVACFFEISYLAMGHSSYKTRRKYQYLYAHDALTGIYNRSAFNEFMDIYKTIEAPDGLTLMIIDIDDFKNINDTKGHSIGDEVLKSVAKLIHNNFVNAGNVCRWGGEEFAIFERTAKNASTTAKELLEKIELHEIETSTGEKLFITVSIGVATSPANSKPDIKKMFNVADSNLYIAKNSGKNCVVCNNEEIYFGKYKHIRTNPSYFGEISLWDYKNMLDSLNMTGIYVITEDGHRILFYNRRVQEVAPNIQIGMVCHEVWAGTCDNCPINSIGEKAISHTINYNDPFGDIVEITAYRILWKGSIPAFLIRVLPRDNNDVVDNKTQIETNNHLVGTYTIDSEYKVISYNAQVKRLYPQLKIGEKCYESLLKRDKPCENCPTLKNTEMKANGTGILIWSMPIVLDESKEGFNIFFKDPAPSKNIGHALLDETNLYDLKHTDPVTGGTNREGFIYMVEKLKERTDLTKYAILFINIKDFKAINELFGFEGGDNLLRMVFMSVATSELKPQICARKESDNFVFLILKDNLNLDYLPEILKLKWCFSNQEVLIHCRCGIYNIDSLDKSISGMIDRARLAKNFIVDEHVKPYEIYNSSMRTNYIAQAEIVSTYEEAIKNQEFKVYFQPVVNTQTGKIVSAEALVRWQNPKRGFIAPNIFVPTLEKYGYISKLDIYVTEFVIKYLTSRQNKNKKIVPVSINLSWMDFYDSEMMKEIMQLLKETSLPKGTIRFEITETSYTSLETNQSELINNIRNQGSKILLDDFGSGYSSFGMIQNYDFDILKIDMSFIKQLQKNPKVKNIVETIITMCHKLGIKVVAEGVEDKSEVSFLKEKDCDFIQGYYYSKPLNTNDFENFLEK